jgi:hypothetical protein
MDATTFRRMALGMDGAVEGAHMGHPDFRVNGRIFATLHPGDTRGMVKLTPDQQREFMRASGAFEPAAGAWGRGGSTLVTLSAIDEETLGEAMTLAWREAIATASVKRARSKKAPRPNTTRARSTRPSRAAVGSARREGRKR